VAWHAMPTGARCATFVREERAPGWLADRGSHAQGRPAKRGERAQGRVPGEREVACLSFGQKMCRQALGKGGMYSPSAVAFYSFTRSTVLVLAMLLNFTEIAFWGRNSNGFVGFCTARHVFR
jgi:hypothetical protein